MNNDKEANKKLSSNLQSVQTIILTKMVIVSCIKKHITNESSETSSVRTEILTKMVIVSCILQLKKVISWHGNDNMNMSPGICIDGVAGGNPVNKDHKFSAINI